MPSWSVSGPFVGRAAELSQVHDLLAFDPDAAAAAPSPVRAVVVTGDAGLGKSRLLAEYVAQAHASGTAILHGTCLEVGESWPYYPIQEALRYASHTAEQVDVSSVATDLLAALRDVIDASGAGAGGAAGDGRSLEQLYGGLTRLADQRPAVLVIDDLQWADSSTRRLILTLLSGVSTARLRLLASVRSEALDPQGPVAGLLRELQRSRAAEIIELAPLSREASDDLASAVAGQTLSRTASDNIWNRAAGNPFIIEELVHGGSSGSAMPQKIKDSMLGRIGALPAGAQAMARAISVSLTPVPHEVLPEVLNISSDDVIGAARATVAAKIVAALDEGYQIRHQLMREVLEGDLLPVERTRLHLQFAEALERRGNANADDLAYHWLRAGSPQRALPAVVASAEVAERLPAPVEAWKHWQSAVALVDSMLLTKAATTEQRAEVYARAAEAAHRNGEHDAALELLTQLDSQSAHLDPRLTTSGSSWARLAAGERTVTRARYLAAAGRFTAAEEAYNAALALDDLPPVTRADAAARSAELLLQHGQTAAAGTRARLALDLSRELPENPTTTATQILAGATYGLSLAYGGDPDAGHDALDEAIRTAETAGIAELIGVAYRRKVDLLIGGDHAQLEAGIERALTGAELVVRIGGARTHGAGLFSTASNGLFRLGRWAEAAHATSRAIDCDPTGAAAVDLLLARARIVIGLGQLERGEEDLRSVETLLAEHGGTRPLITLWTLRAGLAMWQHDATRAERARLAVHRALQLAGDEVDDVWLMAPLVWHGLRAEAEAVSDGLPADFDTVTRLRVAADRLILQSGDSSPLVANVLAGYELLNAAELTRIHGTSDPEAWQRAADFWTELQQPYPAAYSYHHQALAMFSTRTRNKDAASALRLAYATAVRLSAGPLRTQIESLGSRARVALVTTPLASAAGEAEGASGGVVGGAGAAGGAGVATEVNPLELLTSREAEVLAEIAAGHSNQEIADRLFISVRTVGVHVSNLLAKIQARSRVEATSIYLRHRGSR